MQELNAGGIHFIGQQDGDIEREFLAKISNVLENASAALSAYLCRVHYGNPNDINVALCIASSKGESRALIESLSAIFREMFGSQEHLDMLFLNEEQEQQIRSVCSPFYHAT